MSEGQLEKYTELTLKQFVASAADIRWCPYPDCSYAICIRREAPKEEVKEEVGGGASKDESMSEESETASVEYLTESDEGKEEEGVASPPQKKLTPGKNVECGQGHSFCW